MQDQPPPREVLIALQVDHGLPRQELYRLTAEVARRARESPAAALPDVLPAAARARLPVPAWSSPEGAAAAAAAEIAAAAAVGARLVTLVDPAYPPALAALELAPPVLAVRGELPPGPAVAIVGSRLGDAYGREVAARFARDLAAAGVTVVSGLARGIDAAAHEGALAIPSGLTVAVLGCGMGIEYPRGHGRLAEAIAGRGALVSEFPCGAAPRRWHFPVRNRIIAALAGVTLVIQATPRSGSLATARHARRLQRPVFAVPGPVFEPLSWGPHALLRSGALLAGHPQDILDVLDAPPPQEAADCADSPLAAAVLATLHRRGARTAAQVAARAGIGAEAALSALLELELDGLIERLPGMSYRLARATRRRRAGARRSRKGAAAPCDTPT
jgi:DNA processing protein